MSTRSEGQVLPTTWWTSGLAASRHLAIHPCVYYASSHSNEAIQTADLVAAIRRRVAEGDKQLNAVDLQLASIRSPVAPGPTVKGRRFTNWITLF